MPTDEVSFRVNVRFFRGLRLIKSHRDMHIHAMINGCAVTVSKVISRSKIARMNGLDNSDGLSHF